MKTEVFISGAGPSGLSAALFLASRGRRVVIIDKNENRTDKSKAIGVQPGTLEVLEKCFGADLPIEMIQAGLPARQFFFHVDDDLILPVVFQEVPSKYNSLLMLQQSETERILEERLGRYGVRVLRRHEFVNMKQNGPSVSIEVKGPAGELINYQADYLIGCDGAHSPIRHLLKLDFEGGSYDGEFVLADLRVDWPWAYETVHAFVSRAGAAAFFPLTGKQRYRLVLIPRAGSQAGREPGLPIDLEQLRAEAADYLPANITLSDPAWLTRFRVHHRMVDKMGDGRVFLCGDAAHIHSPVGAQGMNTGIQDSIDLCWRLHEILSHRADSSLLDGFLDERHANGDRVVRITDLAFRFIFGRENWFTNFTRRKILPRLITKPLIQRRVIRLISQIDVASGIIANIRA